MKLWDGARAAGIFAVGGFEEDGSLTEAEAANAKNGTHLGSRILTRRPECLLARPDHDGEGERMEFIKCTGAFQRDECKEHYLLVCGVPRFNNQHMRLIVVVKL